MSELNKAEKYFEQSLKKLIEEGYKDRDVRPSYENGDEATSTFITQIVEEYDISKGELPITETRYIGWKSAINELLAIYQSQTNTQDGFDKHSVLWWKPWMNEDGNIGRAYSYNLESHRHNEMRRNVVKVKKKILSKEDYEIKEIGFLNEIHKSIDGKIYKSDYREYGEYIIIDKFQYKKPNEIKSRPYVKVQFLNNGYITSLREDSLIRGQHPKNNYIRTMNGIGYIGDYSHIKNYTKDEINELRNIWLRMMQRCYDGTRVHYDDIYVSNNWHCFSNFLKDIKHIPQYHLAKESNFNGWHLDKDYYGSNCYSKDTCVFLNTKDNLTYRSNQCNPIKVTDGDHVFIVLSKKELSLIYRVGESTIGRWVKNGSNTNKTILLEELPMEDEYLYRYELSRNQINELLNELVHNKFSRRHITSFFNWSNHNKKMLVECAFETLWTAYEKDGDTYLDLTLIQRSSDVLTANHINKIQYVAFMMMIAKHCGYKCGKFVHFVQNYHIYNSHLENLEVVLKRVEQLKQREIQSQPKLNLNVPDGTDFYNITADDFELVDYNPIKPQLKFDLAI